MIKDLLKSFYRSSSLKPKRLIFYRDGVSEGQFAEVQRFEITQVISSSPENRILPAIALILDGSAILKHDFASSFASATLTLEAREAGLKRVSGMTVLNLYFSWL